MEREDGKNEQSRNRGAEERIGYNWGLEFEYEYNSHASQSISKGAVQCAVLSAPPASPDRLRLQSCLGSPFSLVSDSHSMSESPAFCFCLSPAFVAVVVVAVGSVSATVVAAGSSSSVGVGSFASRYSWLLGGRPTSALRRVSVSDYSICIIQIRVFNTNTD